MQPLQRPQPTTASGRERNLIDHVARQRAQVKHQLVARRQRADAAGLQTRVVGPVHFVQIDRRVIGLPSQQYARRFEQRVAFGGNVTLLEIVGQRQTKIVRQTRRARIAVLEIELAGSSGFEIQPARRTGRGTFARCRQRSDRNQDLLQFAFDVARRPAAAVTQQSREFADGLPGLLIGNAVYRDDRDALVLLRHARPLFVRRGYEKPSESRLSTGRYSSSRYATSALSSLISVASISWSSCVSFETPTTGAVMPGLLDQPRERDLRRRLAVLVGDFDDPIGDFEHRIAAIERFRADPVTALRTLRRTGGKAALVRARQNSTRQRRPRRERDSALHAVRVHLALFFAIHEVVVVLHRYELRPAVHPGGQLQFGELPREHRRTAEVQHLAGLHDVVQRLHRLFDRHFAAAGHAVRMTVNDEVIDVVVAEPLQARVHPFDDVFARQAGLVGAAAHRHRDLRRQHVFVARQQLAQQLPHYALAGADPVHVGAVEIEQTFVDCGLEDRPRFVGTQRPVALVATAGFAEVHRAEAQPRNLQAAVFAELDGFEHEWEVL